MYISSIINDFLIFTSFYYSDFALHEYEPITDPDLSSGSPAVAFESVTKTNILATGQVDQHTA